MVIELAQPHNHPGLLLTGQKEPRELSFLQVVVLPGESCTNLACEYIDEENPWQLLNLYLHTPYKVYCGLSLRVCKGSYTQRGHCQVVVGPAHAGYYLLHKESTLLAHLYQMRWAL